MRALCLALIAAAIAGAVSLRAGGQQEPFPHEKHARLFPLCEGCHEGVPEENRAAFHPAPQLCDRCHNGTDQPRVTWAAPAPRPTNLDFSHATHARQAAARGDEIECSGCHTPDGTPRMAVRRRVEPDRCFACHAHRATNHFVDAVCSQCHDPLAATALPVTRIAAFPVPPSHEQPRFLEEFHGRLARSEPERCATCHTRELCATCHVDVATRTEAQAIPPAGPALRLPPAEARYFVPPSHLEPQWLEQHGPAARGNIASCSACHTRESCETCHNLRAPRPITDLPRRADVTAPGVLTERSAPPTHQAPFFEREHGTLAAARPQSCGECHTRTMCERCHTSPRAIRDAAPDTAPQHLWSHAPATLARVDSGAARQAPAARSSTARGFHPANFIERHASASYGRNLDCQNCHDTTLFCRDCHESRGMGAVGRLQPGFHDAQPNWLLNHGRPARQALESCASCHTQRDCTQCHSELGAFRINPHGPGFRPERLIERNARVCFACHVADPTRRSAP